MLLEGQLLTKAGLIWFRDLSNLTVYLVPRFQSEVCIYYERRIHIFMTKSAPNNQRELIGIVLARDSSREKKRVVPQIPSRTVMSRGDVPSSSIFFFWKSVSIK
jgi:hypothetical protein